MKEVLNGPWGRWTSGEEAAAAAAVAVAVTAAVAVAAAVMKTPMQTAI